MPSQTINGFEFHYREQGTAATGGAGAPLVLVHGFPLDSTCCAA